MRIIILRAGFPAEVFAYSSEGLAVVVSECPSVSRAQETFRFGRGDPEGYVVQVRSKIFIFGVNEAKAVCSFLSGGEAGRPKGVRAGVEARQHAVRTVRGVELHVHGRIFLQVRVHPDSFSDSDGEFGLFILGNMGGAGDPDYGCENES